MYKGEYSKKNKKIVSMILAATLTAVSAVTAFAMPADVNGSENGDIFPVRSYYTALGEYNVHTGPSTAYPVIGVTETGEEYYVDECEGAYYYINYGSTQGFVITGAMVPSSLYEGPRPGDNTAGNNVMNDNLTSSVNAGYAMEDLDLIMDTTVSVNVRQAPTTDSAIIGGLKENQQVLVTGALTDYHWYQVSYGGQTGYVYDDYLVPEMPQTMAATFMVNMREQPTTDSAIIKTLQVGDKVKATQLTDNGWYKFSIDGVIGYAYGEYFAAVQ